MRAFERQLITEWRRLELPASGAAVVAAVSGGADSISLLIALNELQRRSKLRLRLVAAHFNHQFRGEESETDEQFVRELCSERGIELAVGHARRKPDSNIEQAARLERYDFLLSTAKNIECSHVITAHTRDDQAETFLLNLIRGSGIVGLAGMPTDRELTTGQMGVRLTRPLVRWARRSDTEAYCVLLGIKYRSDSMNEDEAFTRVRIRKVLLPLLRDFNPKIVDRLADTATLLQEQLGDAPHIDRRPLKIADLKKLSAPDLSRSVRSWLASNRGDLRQIEMKHIEAICRLVNSRKSGKTVELPGGTSVVKGSGVLAFGENNVEKSPPGA
jgi:tRNA(Ile)-lysidine synthase